MSAEVWSYDSPGVVKMTGDYTTNYPVNTKVQLTQTTLKFFVVTNCQLVDGKTYLTLDGQGKYTLANALISSHLATQWSSPTAGFPLTDPIYSSSSHDHDSDYVLSDGVSGGQTIIGGTGSGDGLTLESTSHGTKGYVSIQPNGGQVGIGISNPAAGHQMHLYEQNTAFHRCLIENTYNSAISQAGIGFKAGGYEWIWYVMQGSGDKLNLYSTSANNTLMSIDTNGTIFTPGKLSMRPFIEIGRIAQNSKPTIVQRGASSGYSLPIWNSDNEELYISEYIAGRWDGASNITLSVIGYLASAEDVNDDFALQVSWTNKSTGSGVLSDAVTNVEVRTNIDTDRNAQYSMYKVDFTIDWDYNDPDILSSDYFAARIRRIAVGGGYTEISGEFVVTMIIITYNVNKVFKAA